MTHRYLYIDETGDFENPNPNEPLIIAGFLTSKNPEELANLYLQFLNNIGHDTSNPEIHMTELRRQAPEQVEAINRYSPVLLNQLHAEIVYVKWQNDPIQNITILKNSASTNRFFHMMQTLLRGVITFPSVGSGSIDHDTIIPTLAQRSIDVESVTEGNLLGEVVERRDRDGYMCKVFTQNHEEVLFRSISTNAYVCSKKVSDILIDQPKKLGATNRERRYGLMVADIVCHLLRAGVITENNKLIGMAIPYGEQWSQFERSLPTLHRNVSYFETYAKKVIQSLEQPSLLQRCKLSHLRFLLTQPEVRAMALNVVANEQRTKTGIYPISTFILGELTMEETLSDLRLWLTQSNHAGRAVNDTAEDILNPEKILTKVHAGLAQDIAKFVLHAEDYARLAVSHQDIFRFDDAVSVIEDYFLPIATPLVQNSLMTWTEYGRCVSNLAQSLAMRNEGDDATRAISWMREARTHFSSNIDMSQWYCHMGSIAAMVGDEAAYLECVEGLFQSTELENILYGFTINNKNVFGYATLLRAAIFNHLPQSDVIKAWLTNEHNWRATIQSLAPIKNRHPVERIVRYLGELAPKSIFKNLETELISVDCPPIFSPKSTIQVLTNIATYAAWARRAKILEVDASPWLERLYEEFNTLMYDYTYYTPSLLDQHCSSGYFFEIWELVKNQYALGDISLDTLEDLLQHFRCEWR